MLAAAAAPNIIELTDAMAIFGSTSLQKPRQYMLRVVPLCSF
jgi:hypothetical protein